MLRGVGDAGNDVFLAVIVNVLVKTQTEAANFRPAFLPATPQPLPWLTFWEGPRSLAESCLDLLVGQTTSARPSAA